MLGKITLSSVKALAAGVNDILLWDEDLRGFGIKVTPAGKKVYIVQYRMGKKTKFPKRFTIGTHGTFTPDEARKAAKIILGKVADGIDPSSIKQDQKKQLNIHELAERYLEEYAKHHKKASSYEKDRQNIKFHILPLIGNFRIAEVKRPDIEKLKFAISEGKTAKTLKGEKLRSVSKVKGGPGAANRCLALLSKMFNLAEIWELRADGTNPCRLVKRYEEHKHERYLSEEEFSRLGEALISDEAKKENSLYALAALKLLIFTGCRLNEILTLKWEYIDFERNEIRLPDSKTGAKRVFLNEPARLLLQELPREIKNPYVIVGEKPGSHIATLEKPWQRIKKMAELKDIRRHDLRHSFAAMGAGEGLSLSLIGKLLGHKNVVTTQRYAHLADSPVRSANDQIAKRIENAMQSKKPK